MGRITRGILLFVVVFSCAAHLAEAYDRGREIKIIWGVEERILYISYNGKVVKNPHNFTLRADDKVIIGIQGVEKDEDAFEINYEIISAKNPYQLPAELRTVTSGKTASASDLTTKYADMESRKGTIAIVTKDLESGGKLLIHYINKKENKGIIDILLKIKEGYPLFVPSTGFVFSNEIDPSLSIVTKPDGGECLLVYKNKDESTIANVKPKQDLIQFFNFRLYEGLYLSFGFPLTLSKKVYENPHLGLTFYPGQGLAFMLSGGVTFHKELQILESSGYKAGQAVDETLKVDAVPTEEKYHLRFYLGLSFRL